MRNEFVEACHRIESDINFQPNITNKGLFSLVVNKDGSAKHAPRRSALSIQNFAIQPRSENGDLLGKVYQIKIAVKSATDCCDYPVWNIDTSAVILVDLMGEYSLHPRENAEQGNFNGPITHRDVNDFLNQSSLSFPEIQKHREEIAKNSGFFSQERSKGTSLFATLPAEVLVKIAALTGDENFIPENEARQIAFDNFSGPKLA